MPSTAVTSSLRPCCRTRLLGRRFPTALLTLAAALIAVSACGEPTAWGELNSLVVVAPDSLWHELEEPTYQVLEPTIFTTRDEKQYVVTHVDPSDPAFEDLKRFRNVVLFGTRDDPLMQEVASAAGVSLSDVRPPYVFQAEDVWARGQLVTAALLWPGREAESWAESLPGVLAAVDRAYRVRVRQKMFVTPPDSALARDLGRRFGFEIVVPEVYYEVVRDLGGGDSLVILRNDNPDPNQLIRSILVAWRDDVEALTPVLALEWRAAIDSVHYNVAQGIDASHSSVTRFTVDGHEALEVTGVWQDERGNFPAAGPFIVWLVRCPGRTYFIDAWLYAPNEPKYEYMLQLQEILGSFRCASVG